MNNYFNLINYDELTVMLANSIKIPSINPTGNELPMCQFVENLLKENNIEYETVLIEKNRYDIIARLKGKSKENSMIFTGHMDVVPVSDDELKRWSVEPFSATIKDGYMYGRGSSDMKSGLISAIYAMITLKRNNIVPSNDIILIATVDEENYMKGSTALIGSSLLQDAKYLVVCEPTNLKVCNAQKGRTWADVYVKGKTAHGSQKNVGENAIYLAIKLIERIKNTDFEKYPETFWRTLAISAGVEPQVVPDNCKFTVDARLQVGHNTKDVWNKLDKIIDEIKKEVVHFDASYDIIDERDSWYTEENSKIILDIKNSLSNLGIKYETDVFQGSTDASKLIKNNLIPVIIGPGNLNVVHKEDECVKLEQVHNACKLYVSLMLS